MSSDPQHAITLTFQGDARLGESTRPHADVILPTVSSLELCSPCLQLECKAVGVWFKCF